MKGLSPKFFLKKSIFKFDNFGEISQNKSKTIKWYSERISEIFCNFFNFFYELIK